MSLETKIEQFRLALQSALTSWPVVSVGMTNNYNSLYDDTNELQKLLDII